MDTKNIIKYKDFIIEVCSKLYSGDYEIAIVGSRVRNDYIENSDFDIVIFAKDDDIIKIYPPIYLDNIKFTINKRPIDRKNNLSGYDLSYYSLSEEKLYVGKDDDKYLADIGSKK